MLFSENRLGTRQEITVVTKELDLEGANMDQITVKTPNPKGSLFLNIHQ